MGRTGAICSDRHWVNSFPRKCSISPRKCPVRLHILDIFCVNVFIYCFNQLTGHSLILLTYSEALQLPHLDSGIINITAR